MAGMCTGGWPRALSQLPPNLTPQPQARSDPTALPVRSSQSYSSGSLLPPKAQNVESGDPAGLTITGCFPEAGGECKLHMASFLMH